MGAPDEDVISTIASSRSSISEPALHLDEDAKSAKIEITCEPLTPQDTTSGSDGDERVHAWDCGKQRRALSGQLASFMAESRSHSGTLFRRFDRANFRGLMGMEREVAVLEERLERLEGGRMVKEESVRELERELRERVREYYEAVLLTKEILALSRPSKNALLETRRAFPPEDFRPDSAEKTPYFSDKYYTRRQESDLSSLSPCADPDPLTRFFERQSDGGNVAHLVTFLSAICAVLFLVGAIVGLYFVSNARARLGMLGTFTVLFAAACASLGNVRRQDVFVATAAYAAVLVVFVSGNIAANPEPTTCILSSTEGATNANLAALNTAGGGATVTQLAQGVTVTATAVHTVTSYESLQTIVSTIVSRVTTTATPTVIIKKGELSDFAKTGIGVGASVGALFCIMVLAGAAVSLRRRKWNFEWVRMFRSKKRSDGKPAERKMWRLAGGGNREGREEGEKEREKGNVDIKERESHNVWV